MLLYLYFMNLYQWAVGPTQPPMHYVPGGTVAGVCSAKVKDGQSCRYTPPYALLAWSLIKYQMTLFHFNISAEISIPQTSLPHKDS